MSHQVLNRTVARELTSLHHFSDSQPSWEFKEKKKRLRFLCYKLSCQHSHMHAAKTHDPSSLQHIAIWLSNLFQGYFLGRKKKKSNNH